MNLPQNVSKRWSKELKALRKDLDVISLNGKNDQLKVSRALKLAPQHQHRLLVLCPYPEGDLRKIKGGEELISHPNVRIVFGVENFVLTAVKQLVQAPW